MAIGSIIAGGLATKAISKLLGGGKKKHKGHKKRLKRGGGPTPGTGRLSINHAMQRMAQRKKRGRR